MLVLTGLGAELGLQRGRVGEHHAEGALELVEVGDAVPAPQEHVAERGREQGDQAAEADPLSLRERPVPRLPVEVRRVPAAQPITNGPVKATV